MSSPSGSRSTWTTRAGCSARRSTTSRSRRREGAVPLHRRRRPRRPGRPRTATSSKRKTGSCWPRTARRSGSPRTTSPSTARWSLGLEKTVEVGVGQLEVSDSELLVKQMKGEYRVKNENLRPLAVQASRLARESRRPWTSVRREHNELADRLVNEALDRGDAVRLGAGRRGARPRGVRRRRRQRHRAEAGPACSRASSSRMRATSRKASRSPRVSRATATTSRPSSLGRAFRKTRSSSPALEDPDAPGGVYPLARLPPSAVGDAALARLARGRERLRQPRLSRPVSAARPRITPMSSACSHSTHRSSSRMGRIATPSTTPSRPRPRRGAAQRAILPRLTRVGCRSRARDLLEAHVALRDHPGEHLDAEPPGLDRRVRRVKLARLLHIAGQHRDSAKPRVVLVEVNSPAAIT